MPPGCGVGVASISGRGALKACVQAAHATRFPVIAMMAAIITAATLPSTDARAQFACVTGPPATCTNTGTEPGDFFPAPVVFPFDVNVINSGTAQNLSVNTAAGGNSSINNSGTALDLNANTVDTGNATALNSNAASSITATTESGTATATNALGGTVTNNVLATTTLGGNAIANNAGTVNGTISAITNSGGNATTNNSGTALSDVTTRTFNGGNANLINSGTLGGSVLTRASGGGDATTNNLYSGTIFGNLTTRAGGGGNATTNNFGTVNQEITTRASNVGNAVANNFGSAGVLTTFVTGSGNAATNNFGNTFAIQTRSNEGTATSVNYGNVGFVATETQNGGAATTVNWGVVNGVIQTVTDFGGNATTINYGTVNGIVESQTSFGGTPTIVNFGTIVGVASVAASGQSGGVITNAGRIIADPNFSDVAISLFQPDPTTPTTLNILPGSRIVGEIILNGDTSDPFAVGTKVNILSGHDISSVLTFGGSGCGCTTGGLTDTGSTVNVTGGAPYVINGNTVAILDPTSFANADRNVIDVTRTITSLVTSRLTNPAPISGNGSSAIGFAPSGNVARDMANDAFSGIPALAYAGNDRVLLSNPSFTAADGTSIWAQGFGGQRIQQADAPTLRSVSNFYGGVLGADKTVQPGLRLGAFIGAGNVKSTIDLNSGDTTSDMVFGGIYGRYAMGRAFLDFSLLGGGSSNDVKRTIANNLVPGGYEYAAGKYNGWFISPEIAYGLTRSLGYNLTLTPSARVRYLAAGFGGYEESGSSTNLSVRSRVSHNFEERGELKLTHTTNATPTEQLQLSGTAGLIALQRAGDSTVNTILLGQSLAFATPGKASIVGFYAGAGFDWRNASGVSVFGAAEFTAMSDQSQTITGRGGVKVAF